MNKMKKIAKTLLIIGCSFFLTVKSYKYTQNHNIPFLQDNIEALTDEGDDIIEITLQDIDIVCDAGGKGRCWDETGVGGWRENAAGLIYFWPDNCEWTGYVYDMCL